MDKVTPKCPYCGTEMVLRDWHDVFFGKGNFYECVCGAKSPIKVSHDEACAAAMRRWVEPNRVLAWEEFLALPDKMLVCREYRGDERYSPRHMWEGYGKTWRAWLRRPTDEERASTPWAQNDA